MLIVKAFWKAKQIIKNNRMINTTKQNSAKLIHTGCQDRQSQLDDLCFWSIAWIQCRWKSFTGQINNSWKIWGTKLYFNKNMWDNSSGMISTFGSCLGRVYDVINVCNALTPLLYRDGSHACEVHPHAKRTLYIPITQYSFSILGVLYILDI